MDSVIAQLQRERLRLLKNDEHLSRVIADSRAQSEALEEAISQLGGDASETACQEAEDAFQRKVNPGCEQESASERLGVILGR